MGQSRPGAPRKRLPVRGDASGDEPLQRGELVLEASEVGGTQGRAARSAGASQAIVRTLALLCVA